jgi:predicted phage terminase large subunit-like protein
MSEPSSLGREAWRLGLGSFAEWASPWRKKWLRYPWVRHLANQIQIALTSRRDARVIINAPPRHGKSLLVSHWLPVWFLEWWPMKRIILASYGDSLASEWGRSVRDEFQMNEYLTTKLRGDSTAVSDWMTLEGGGMRTAGVGGPIVGKGADLILIDDAHKNWEDATSPQARGRLIDWFKSTLYTRAEPGAAIVVIMTRWHEMDLTGYLTREHADKWTQICYPALAEDNDIIGRQPGEALCPHRFSASRLAQIKKTLGSYMYAGLYQQRPAPLEGGLVRRQWVKSWQTLPAIEEWLQTWDLTFKATGSSYVVGQVWGRAEANYYLVDQVRGKWDFPDTLREMVALSHRWPQALTKLVEDKANGPAVIATLRNTVPGIVAFQPRGSKEARLAAVSGAIESGNVFIPDAKQATWAGDLLEELVNFPHAVNDDQVDCLTMALDRFTSRSAESNFVLPLIGARERPWSFAHAKVS